MPVDEMEQDRNDLQHHKFKLIIGGALYRAPLTTDPARILDLGTESGIWAIEAANKYASAIAMGVDIAAVQPTSNRSFEILDIEDSWMMSPNSFDFIHA
jgi:ribosomal protein L11 methylase PrmA